MPDLNGRWQFHLDVNRDGLVTITDVARGFAWVFFVPGDGLLYLLMAKAPALARFFELTPANYGGLASGILSFLAWVVVFMMTVRLVRKGRELIRQGAKPAG